MSFWSELKRRNVFKVGAAYAIVAWLLAQVVSLAFQAFQMPQWTVTFVVSLLIVGFPIALILAWAYEMTPEGVKLTKKVPLSESITHVTGRKLNYVFGGLFVVAVALLIFDNYYLDQRVVETETLSTAVEQKPVASEAIEIKASSKTIVVLPFKNLSSDPEQENFVDGLTVEISDYIGQIPDLNITGRTSAFAFKDSPRTAQEISVVLGVEYILAGDVRKAGDNLRINAQLLKGIDGFELWSKKYDRKLENIFDIQEDIATSVADELKLALGIGKSLKQVGGTDNVEAYEHYLVAKGKTGNITDTEDLAVLHYALQEINAAIRLDPSFALAWAKKSDIHVALAIYGPLNSTVTEQTAGQSAAKTAIELQSNLSVAYVSLGESKLNRGDFIEARSDFSRALELRTEPLSGDELAIGVHYLILGYFKEADKLFEKMRQNDPLNKAVRAHYLIDLALLENTKLAEEEYERVKALVGDQWTTGDKFISIIRLGSDNVASRDMIVYSDMIYDVGKEYIDLPEKGLIELRRIYDNNDKLSSSYLSGISVWAAYFGDTDFSIEAFEKSISINSAAVGAIWNPVMHEVRQSPRFKKLAREIGLVDYWEQFGWPDLCRPLDDGDFVCD